MGILEFNDSICQNDRATGLQVRRSMSSASLTRIEGYNSMVRAWQARRQNDLTIQRCVNVIVIIIGIQKRRIRLKIHYQLDCARWGLFDEKEAFISDLSAIRRPARPNFRDRDNNDKLVDNKPAGGSP